MIWQSWSDFLSMGGYAPYVWGSFGVVFLLMAAEIILLAQRAISVRAQLANAHAPNSPRTGASNETTP